MESRRGVYIAWFVILICGIIVATLKPRSGAIEVVRGILAAVCIFGSLFGMLLEFTRKSRDAIKSRSFSEI